MKQITRQVNRIAAQGDLLIRRIDKIPDQARKVKATRGEYVVAHSETGHHHTITEAPPVSVFMDPNSGMRSYVQVDKSFALLEHQRAWDKHDTLKIGPGTYEIRRQREWTPWGDRRVED